MTHEYYMQLAINLAATAKGQTSPNPLVGAVCVKDGTIIGTGAHMQAGKPHAEVHALQMAGEEAAGADLYVTLEPCAHTGKTPPCALAIIQANISRVFIASLDPFPAVNGRGIELLKEAGIEVITGLLEEQANALNDVFFHYVKTGMPYVTLKAGATLDGRLATDYGDSKWITNAASREDVHQLRHEHDAILVGVETVLHDNPFLTTRLPNGGKHPVRIILDRHLRTPVTAHVIKDQVVETILFASTEAPHQDKYQAYSKVSVEFISPTDDFLPTVLKRLAKRGYLSLFVEGGATIHSAFITEKLADELYYYIAPKLIGNGSSFFQDLHRPEMKDAVNLKFLETKAFDTDLRIHARFIKE